MTSPAARVLIVDDNVEFAGLLGTLCAEQGLVPIVAHSAADAHDLLSHYGPSAVVLDLLLPDQTGKKLLERWRAERPELPPIFVMTGVFKGDAQRANVASIAPIAGWFEKPFDTRRLVERIIGLVGKEAVARTRHQIVGSVGHDFDIEISEPPDMESYAAPVPARFEWNETSPPSPAIDDGSAAKWKLIQRETTGKITALRPGLHRFVDHDEDSDQDQDQDQDQDRDWFSAEEGAADVATDPFVSAFDEGLGIATLSPELMSLGLRTNLRVGDLRLTPAPRLMNAFYLSRETGEIVFENGGERKVVYFSGGFPVYALSNQDADRLGAITRRSTGLPDSEIARALAIAKGTERMIGDVLVELGLLGDAKRKELLHEQTRGIVRSLFAWESGRYIIGFNVPHDIDRVDLKEHPGALVLAGIRDLFDLDRLRRLLPEAFCPMPSPNPPFELAELPLQDAEAALLLLATGTRSVAELVFELRGRLDARGVYACLYALVLLEILVVSRTPLAPA